MFPAVSIGRLAYILVERGIERLAVGKTNHCANLFHVLIGITLVCQQMHGLFLLKIGHHGSSTSTSDAFLKAVSPAFAVISCGEGNSYGHPHKETLEKLEAAGIQVLRTDLLGDITAQWGEDGVTWAYSGNNAAELP